jgi:hypothetical protein
MLTAPNPSAPEWRPVPNAPHYFVSDDGRVRVAARKSWSHYHPLNITGSERPVVRSRPYKPAGRGEKARAAKLSNGDVYEIRSLSVSGLSHDEIAQRFPVCKGTVRHIVKRYTWKHLPPQSPQDAPGCVLP